MSQFAGKLVFLVSDSRSGSTLLSREMTAAFPSVVVTPEASFEPLLRRSKAHYLEPESIVRKLSRKQHIANLGIDPAQLQSALVDCAGELTTDALIRIVVALHLRVVGRADANVVVIKKGNHLVHWNAIALNIRNAQLLHIVRDPRAVISSKLRTSRPYHPYEVMAWGGALLAAVQWRHYAQQVAAAAAAISVVEVRYEDLLVDTQFQLERIGNEIGIACRGRTTIQNYRVPETERAIHKRVEVEGFDSRRIKAWRSELPERDRIVIESLCRRQMVGYGYTGLLTRTRLARGLILVIGSLETLLRTIRHFALRWRWRIQRA